LPGTDQTIDTQRVAAARLRSFPARLGKFVALDRTRRALVIEASIRLAWARLLLAVLPFRVIARGLGSFVPPRPETDDMAADEAARNMARAIGWAVAAAARHGLVGGVCLPQAIAARQMLKARGIASVLYLGAAKSDAISRTEAHAWLRAARIEVTGYPVARTFKPVGCFVE